MSSNQHRNASLFFRTANIIFLLMVIGQVSLMSFSFLAHARSGGGLYPAANKVFVWLIPVIVILAIILSPFLYFSIINKQLFVDSPLRDKLKLYRTANTIRLMVLNLAGILSLLAFLLTAETVYAYVFLGVFMAFLLNRPKASKCIADLALNEKEQRTIAENGAV